jgi:RNA polymerase sigma-70 factor, ECF subfamily
MTGRLVMDIPETNPKLVAAAFARLSFEDRAFVRRAYYYGWTTAQIGADLGVAEGTVKTRLHHALRGLRQALQEMGVAP